MKDNPRTLREIIESVERPTYYVLLFFFFAVTFASEVARVHWSWLEHLRVVLFPAVLIAVFRYFDRLSRTPREFRGFGEELGSAFNAAVAGRTSIATMDLLAFTTAKYYVIFREAGVRVDKLRIFMPSEMAIRDASLLRSEVRQELIHERARAIQNWMSLQKSGRIGSLEFLELPFAPTFHMLFENQHSVVFGFFQPSSEGDSFHTISIFLASPGEIGGTGFMMDCCNLLAAMERLATKKSAEFAGVGNSSVGFR